MSCEPDALWDAYCERRESEYRQRIEGMRCFDCANCAQPADVFKGRIGWCEANGDFVYKHDNPTDAECGCFE